MVFLCSTTSLHPLPESSDQGLLHLIASGAVAHAGAAWGQATNGIYHRKTMENHGKPWKTIENHWKMVVKWWLNGG